MELSNQMIEKMKKRANKASQNAYCPYSNFPVGAAVLTEKGDIFSACNVENASYGLTICAERNAVFQAIAKGQTKILAVVIYTNTKRPTPPCGACRQVINEFGAKADIYCFPSGANFLHYKFNQLFPEPFDTIQSL